LVKDYISEIFKILKPSVYFYGVLRSYMGNFHILPRLTAYCEPTSSFCSNAPMFHYTFCTGL